MPLQREKCRADGSVRTYGACLFEEPQEGGFRAQRAASCFDSENDEAAARRARELRVGFATLGPCCERKSGARLRVSAWPRLAGASGGAGAIGIDSKLAPRHGDKPLQTISIRRASATWTGRFMLAKRMLRASRAPASWQAWATARSSGTARQPTASEWAHAARWSPSGSSSPQHAQIRGASRSGKRRRRSRNTSQEGSSKQPRRGGQGGEMHLERALVTGTGSVPLPAAEAVAGLGSRFLGRSAGGLGGITWQLCAARWLAACAAAAAGRHLPGCANAQMSAPARCMAGAIATTFAATVAATVADDINFCTVQSANQRWPRLLVRCMLAACMPSVCMSFHSHRVQLTHHRAFC